MHYRSRRNLDGNDRAAAQLAVDGEVKYRQILRPALDLRLGFDRPDLIELLSESGQLPAFEVSNFDRTPPLSGTRESTEYQLQDGLFAEGIRDDFEASALLDKQALEKVRGPDRAAMRHWEAQVGNASFEVVPEAHATARS